MSCFPSAIYCTARRTVNSQVPSQAGKLMSDKLLIFEPNRVPEIGKEKSVFAYPA
jgi:hypothetical protein